MPAKGGFLGGYLPAIERSATRSRTWGIIFLILIGLVIVLNVILALIGWVASYETIDPAKHEVVTRTTSTELA